MYFRTVFASFFLAAAVVAAPISMPTGGANPLAALADPLEELSNVGNTFTEGNGSGNAGNGNAGNGNKDNGQC